jgi:Arc/MetJ family transcription regulator
MEESIMRTTLALDDELLAKAQAFTGLKEKSALVREALKAPGGWRAWVAVSLL